MAVTITIAEVKELPAANKVPDAVLQGYIAAVDQANNCLDTNGVPDDIQRALKLNGVWHLVEIQSRGSVDSETSPTGASRKYQDKDGFNSTPYGQILQSLDTNYCLRTALGSPGNSLYLKSVGGITPESQLSNRFIR